MADPQFTTQDPQQTTQQAQTNQSSTPAPFSGPFGGTISGDPTEIDITQDIPLPPLEDDFSLDIDDPVIEKVHSEEITPEEALTPFEVSVPETTLPEVAVDTIPEAIPEAVVAPIVDPIIETIPEVVLETKPEAPVAVDVTTPQTVKEEISEATPVASDIRKKFNELQTVLENTYQIRKLPKDAVVSIIGANNDKLSLSYQFNRSSAEALIIEKQEINKETEEEENNTLSFSCTEKDLLEVHLDDVLLFEETELLTDAKKKLLVMDKLNKFIFLVGEDYKKIEKEIKAQEEAAQERRRLQDVFRNF